MSTSPVNIVWVLESDVFPSGHSQLSAAAKKAGHRVIAWNDEWWADSGWPQFWNEAVVFHGSLGNAARIPSELPWQPGAYCAVDRFRCSSWYTAAKPYLLNDDWRILPADEFVANASAVLRSMNCRDAVFVRPDSPLKPFSGRVLDANGISLRAIDHGFYYDDASLPVVVAPVRPVGREWRFVVARGKLVTGSAYDPVHRKAIRDPVDSSVVQFSESVVAAIPAPDDVFILDVCESDSELRLLELNPFSGADLYFSDADAIVAAVAGLTGR